MMMMLCLPSPSASGRADVQVRAQISPTKISCSRTIRCLMRTCSSLLDSVLSHWFSKEFSAPRGQGGRGRDRFSEGGGVSFRADGTETGEPGPAWLVGVLCRSVGGPQAGARAAGAGALFRGPVEEAAAA